MTRRDDAIDLMESSDWEELLNPAPGGPRLTLTLPTYRRGAETTQNPIRLKNLLRKAEEELTGIMDDEEVEEFLAPAWRLQRDFDFQQHQAAGLALFASRDTFDAYRLPYVLDEEVHVGRTFFIRPLIPLSQSGSGFHILALDENGVRLFKGGRFELEEVELQDVPTSLEEVARLEVVEKSLQFHSGTGARKPGEDRRAMFHGQGAAGDDARDTEKLLDFFRQVDSGVARDLADTREPLVLVGEVRDRGLYRKASELDTIHEDAVAVHPEALTLDQIHARASGVMAPIFEEKRKEALRKLRELAGKEDERAVLGIEAIAPAAAVGRVETLFLPPRMRVWGRLKEDATGVMLASEPEPEDEELLNLAALHTLEKGGEAWQIEDGDLPGVETVAAILRY